mgnify:CR=1 FL=1
MSAAIVQAVITVQRVRIVAGRAVSLSVLEQSTVDSLREPEERSHAVEDEAGFLHAHERFVVVSERLIVPDGVHLLKNSYVGLHDPVRHGRKIVFLLQDVDVFRHA